jgi:hypothetical protein
MKDGKGGAGRVKKKVEIIKNENKGVIRTKPRIKTS